MYHDYPSSVRIYSALVNVSSKLFLTLIYTHLHKSLLNPLNKTGRYMVDNCQCECSCNLIEVI